MLAGFAGPPLLYPSSPLLSTHVAVVWHRMAHTLYLAIRPANPGFVTLCDSLSLPLPLLLFHLSFLSCMSLFIYLIMKAPHAHLAFQDFIFPAQPLSFLPLPPASDSCSLVLSSGLTSVISVQLHLSIKSYNL